MLKNYFKIFIRVTRQNRLFTFLSVFGISLTIMFVMIISMTFESIINGTGPEKESDHLLYAWRLKITGERDGQDYYITGGLSKILCTKYLSELKSPESASLMADLSWEFIFRGERHKDICMLTDGHFWEIYDFEFIEGRGFNQEEVTNRSDYAVIDASLKELFFGNEEKVCGRSIEYNGMQLTVLGVVQDAPPSALNTQAGIFLPHTLVPSKQEALQTGSYSMVFKARTKKDKATIVAEAQEVIRRLDAADAEKRLFMPGPNSNLERLLIGYGDPEDYRGRTGPLLLFLGKFLGILLLPAINLMALNFSRMRERAEEIGVRKTFGATATIIRRQFVFENIMLTLTGGALGMLLAYLAVLSFGSQIHIPIDTFRSAEISYSFNVVIFVAALGCCLLFALLSGALPALRMSALRPVQTLKGGE